MIADDVNGDGRLDLFVANDGTPNHLWINLGGARFAESALMAGVAIDQDGAPKAGMGVHAADLDDDGDNELIVMNLDTESDSFFRNEGKFFVDDTVKVGLRVVSRRFTRFGVALLDFDNDGLIDLYEANGRVGLQAETFAADPYAEPNLLFRGVAGGRFEEVSPRGGTTQPLVATSRAAAFGDLDNDGGIDIVVANRDAAPYLLRNVAPESRPLAALRVLERSGRDAIGAVLSIAAGRRRCDAMCARATAILPPTTRAFTSAWAMSRRSSRHRSMGRRHTRAIWSLRGRPDCGDSPRQRHANSSAAALRKELTR